jgi:hypothetical protein
MIARSSARAGVAIGSDVYAASASLTAATDGEGEVEGGGTCIDGNAVTAQRTGVSALGVVVQGDVVGCVGRTLAAGTLNGLRRKVRDWAGV